MADLTPQEIEEKEVPTCACGCGQKTNLAKRTVQKLGYIKGEPMKFLLGHAGKRDSIKDHKTHFWSLVEKQDGNGCWIWHGTLDKKGYGVYSINRKQYFAHRLSFAWNGGEFTKEKDCCLHVCDNPQCVRPDHLFAGSKADNNADRNQKGRTNPLRGAKSNLSKLTESEIITIRELYKNGRKRKEIASQYGIDLRHVYKIGKRETWKHIPE